MSANLSKLLPQTSHNRRIVLNSLCLEDLIDLSFSYAYRVKQCPLLNSIHPLRVGKHRLFQIIYCANNLPQDMAGMGRNLRINCKHGVDTRCCRLYRKFQLGSRDMGACSLYPLSLFRDSNPATMPADSSDGTSLPITPSTSFRNSS